MSQRSLLFTRHICKIKIWNKKSDIMNTKVDAARSGSLWIGSILPCDYCVMSRMKSSISTVASWGSLSAGIGESTQSWELGTRRVFKSAARQRYIHTWLIWNQGDNHHFYRVRLSAHLLSKEDSGMILTECTKCMIISLGWTSISRQQWEAVVKCSASRHTPKSHQSSFSLPPLSPFGR